MSYERITETWVAELKERLADAKPSLEDAEPGLYDEQIDLACFYARKAKVYKDATVELRKDLEDYRESHKDDATTHEFVSAIESFLAISKRYEDMSNIVWNSFEKKAIRANEEDKPFYDLLAEIYKGMAEEYSSCVDIICDTSKGIEKQDEACSRYIYLEDYFKGTGAEPILHKEIKDPEFLNRYVESYKWRHKKQ